MKAGIAPRHHMTGFTLVELVITLVLIGILSALGIGLLVSPGAYTAGAARDQFVSSALLAQKRALANAGEDEVVALTVEQTNREWIFTVTQDTAQYPERRADRERATLTVNGSSLGDGDSRSFEFDRRGHLVAGNNVNLVFDGTSAHSACISSLGFAYPEACQP